MAAIKLDLDDLQGDLWSRGFPKFNETYYFFSIADSKEKEFRTALKALVSEPDKYISSLTKVRKDWDLVDEAAKRNHEIKTDPTAKKDIIDISNALIAFSKAGLDKIADGHSERNSLGLNYLILSDPAFDRGMIADGTKNLNDPSRIQWDGLFWRGAVHGLLKVAGSSPETIESKLKDIKDKLGHPTNIKDLPYQSSPTNANSRVDGHVRPWEQRLNGHEHFGFRDGLSQPLLKDINSDKSLEKDPYMITAQNIITVTDDPPGTQDGIDADPTRRPKWMLNGSFLAFRKLEQNVPEWRALVGKFADAGCGSAEQCGAKLMGRWPSGAPVAKYPTNDDEPDIKKKLDNNFKYKGVSKFNCPFAAHIRKVNPRTEADAIKNARMIRNGIPYGDEFDEKNPTTMGRGLLFACYQSSLENSFQFVQKSWCNEPRFPVQRTGFDALIGQAKNGQKLHTTMHDANDKDLDPGLGDFAPTVTMKGGEYFFVPSISALKNTLGSS